MNLSEAKQTLKKHGYKIIKESYDDVSDIVAKLDDLKEYLESEVGLKLYKGVGTDQIRIEVDKEMGDLCRNICSGTFKFTDDGVIFTGYIGHKPVDLENEEDIVSAVGDLIMDKMNK